MRRNAQIVAQTVWIVFHVDIHPELLGCIEVVTLPNPFRLGFVTGGPPFSLHVKCDCTGERLFLFCAFPSRSGRAPQARKYR